MKIKSILYDTYSHSYGIGEVLRTNLGVYYGDECLSVIMFVKHVRGIQYEYPIFGDKRLYISFCLNTHVDFDHSNGSYNSVYKAHSHNFSFAHLLLSTVSRRRSYICRIYFQMGALMCALGESTHLQRHFQRVYHCLQIPSVVRCGVIFGIVLVMQEGGIWGWKMGNGARFEGISGRTCSMISGG